METVSALALSATWRKMMEANLNELKLTIRLNDGSEIPFP